MRASAVAIPMLSLAVAGGAAATPPATTATTADWPVTEGAPGGGRFSPLAGIHRGNVGRLREVWRYRHGDVARGRLLAPRELTGSAFESTPLVVEGRLVFTTPFNRVIALDPESGRELWRFDPGLDRSRLFANMLINRGVAFWRDAAAPAGAICAARFFLATLDARLIALDAATGVPCAGFGDAGTLDLAAGLAPLADPWEYNVTSPPTVVGDVVAVGSSVADTLRPAAPPGDVRGFDARSGRLRWTFHPIPRPGQPGHETWEAGTTRTGAANVWSTMTADPERGWLFLPVSSPSPDFYGGDRLGANLYGDSLVVLEAASGRRVWHFQTVHHDLWDYDLAAPPVLVQGRRDGRPVDAVALATKHGFLFLLDRETGAPLFPVEERPVPPSDVPGERAWPTQPFPERPPPLVSQRLSEDDLYAPTPAHLEACRRRLAALRNEGLFTPPSLGGSLVHPFTGGGANWSGAGYDPASGRLFVPVNDLAHVVRLDEVSREVPQGGSGARPLRMGLDATWWALTGRGTGHRYRISPLSGRTLFAHRGLPCNAPPWGRLVAVDLAPGAIAWSVPAGVEAPAWHGYGPPLVTAGGLVFHAGTRELRLRAHDVDTGRVLASFALPAGLHAGPITYRLRPVGPQYLVIAPGGHIGLGTELGDHVIAYTVAAPDSGPDDDVALDPGGVGLAAEHHGVAQLVGEAGEELAHPRLAADRQRP